MSPPFSAVLLAGGKSSRMGQDKAFLEIEGQPLWQRQISILQKLRPHEIFIAGPPRDEWGEYVAVPDADSDAGPLAGLTSALRHCVTPLLLVLAVDLPAMTTDYLKSLLGDSSEETGVIPQMSDHFEPLAAVYPRTALFLVEKSLSSDDRSMQNLARACIAQRLVSPRKVSPSEHELFVNLNTPDDLRALTTP